MAPTCRRRSFGIRFVSRRSELGIKTVTVREMLIFDCLFRHNSGKQTNASEVVRWMCEHCLFLRRRPLDPNDTMSSRTPDSAHSVLFHGTNALVRAIYNVFQKKFTHFCLCYSLLYSKTILIILGTNVA